MATEHPFAPYVRILGKGPTLSRPLTFEESKAAAAMILAGAVEPVQLGAFLCLLRVKTETPEEVAGFVAAAREAIAAGQPTPRADLDWSSYAGKSRQLPWFLLSALLLAQNGIRVFMQGPEDHTEGRLYSRAALEALGIPAAKTLGEAAQHLDKRNFAFMALEHLSPRLNEMLGLKPLLGLRTPLHTIGRMLNPLKAGASMVSVFHPAYRGVHQMAATLLGDQRLAVFKGEGGEAERRPEKPCLVQMVAEGKMGEEEWPAILSESAQPHDHQMDPRRLQALWAGTLDDAFATATVTGTTAIALRLLGRAKSPAQAQSMADEMWAGRALDRIGA
ncbi:MAG: glycosyl transferase family protein [Alphaproteobacteria bacterium]|nr:glycosyl transferase family protein [Alphaproteobacteria bacterium]